MSATRAALITMTFALAAPVLADASYPREGIAGIPNGTAAPFVGAWSLGFPEGEGVIASGRLVECDAPVQLEDGGEGTLIYLSPKGSEVTFDLTEFAGRTTWLPEQGESILAVWTGADEFYTYSVDLATGKARWDSPQVFRRCK